jgi:hypothetical protein
MLRDALIVIVVCVAAYAAGTVVYLALGSLGLVTGL